VKLVHIVGFFTKKFVMMDIHMNFFFHRKIYVTLSQEQRHTRCISV